MNKHTKRILAVGLPLTVVAATGIGYASWTSDATGAAGAKSLQTVTSTIVAVSPTADLYPGKTGGAASVTITNKNPYPASVTSITGGVSDVNGSCAAGSVTVDNVAAPGGGVLAAAGSVGDSAVYAVVTNMASTATNACRNITFSIPVSAVLTTGTGTP